MSAVIEEAPKDSSVAKDVVKEETEEAIVDRVHHCNLRVRGSFVWPTPTFQTQIILFHITANHVLAQRKCCIETCSEGL